MPSFPVALCCVGRRLWRGVRARTGGHREAAPRRLSGGMGFGARAFTRRSSGPVGLGSFQSTAAVALLAWSIRSLTDCCRRPSGDTGSYHALRRRVISAMTLRHLAAASIVISLAARSGAPSHPADAARSSIRIAAPPKLEPRDRRAATTAKDCPEVGEAVRSFERTAALLGPRTDR